MDYVNARMYGGLVRLKVRIRKNVVELKKEEIGVAC